MQALAELRDLWAGYGTAAVLKGATFSVLPGGVLALLGPNGTGKSTSIGVLAGQIRPIRGEVRVSGADPRIAQSRRNFGLAPQTSAFPPTMRVQELLEFCRAHYACAPTQDDVVADFDLGGDLSRIAAEMSGGKQRKLSVALAFCSGAPLLLLDEPTTGLDGEARALVWRRIREFRDKGGGVLLTTHLMAEAEALADRVAVLADGLIIFSERISELRRVINRKTISFQADRAPKLNAACWEHSEGYSHHYHSADADLAVRELIGSGLAFSGLEVVAEPLDVAINRYLASRV